MRIVGFLNDLSDHGAARKAWLSFAILVFLSIILLPSVFVVTKVFTDWGMVAEVFGDSEMMALIRGAVANSFSIALIVTFIDIVAGLPVAWMMVRREFKGKRTLDTLLDMPLAFPTAVLGLSVVMFWCAPEGVEVPSLDLSLSPYVLLLLLHIIFTYPYMVRSLSGILEQIEPSYEVAAMTLGASRFTAVRTITLPLFRAGLVTGFILCFARSLSETGGTYIALMLMGVKSTFFTGPTFMSYMKEDGVAESMGAEATGAMVVISVIMIALALLLLFFARWSITRIHVGGDRVWPEFERKVSRGLLPKSKDVLAIGFMMTIVLLPAFYIFAYLAHPTDVDNSGLLSSIGLSFLIAGTAVVFDIIFGIPVALHIARHRGEKGADLLDTLVNVPLLVPTTALGFSLALFWGGGNTSGWVSVVLVILGHISFTYPLVVRNITGAVEEVDPSFEETAMTLGAKPLQAFRRVLLPIIKSSVIAGAILAFTRSLGETGATIAISKDTTTVPVYIVKLVNEAIDKSGAIVNSSNIAMAAMCSMALIAICFVSMLAVRFLTHREDKHRG